MPGEAEEKKKESSAAAAFFFRVCEASMRNKLSVAMSNILVVVTALSAHRTDKSDRERRIH